MPTAHVCDIEVHYDRRGSGPPLLYLSGSGGDLRRANAAEGPLAERFEVLAYDQRGLAQTSKPPGPYTMAEYAVDAAAMIELAGWERAHVVGVSFGGMVGQELAIRYPDRVDRAVFACSSSGGAGKPSYPIHSYLDMTPAEAARTSLGVVDTRHDEEWFEANAELLARATEVRARQRDPEVAEGIRCQMLARAEHDTYKRLPQIVAPVLVAGGRYDGQAPPQNQEALASQIPDAVLEWFEGGHGFVREDPRASPRFAEFLLEG